MLFDIIFVSYQEPNADANWDKLVDRFPYAKRIHGVKGIHQAHRQAALLSWSKMFWVVDGDSEIVDDFNFELPYHEDDIIENGVYVYRSKNPVNNLIYGYGGLKLLPKQRVLNMDLNSTDMTTSIADNFYAIDKVASVTNFNTDPFNTWKSAFRECVKLSSRVITGQIDAETEQRLNVWRTVGADKPFGKYAIEGANAGFLYGTNNKDNKEALRLINDFNWLKNKFNEIQP